MIHPKKVRNLQKSSKVSLRSRVRCFHGSLLALWKKTGKLKETLVEETPGKSMTCWYRLQTAPSLPSSSPPPSCKSICTGYVTKLITNTAIYWVLLLSPLGYMTRWQSGTTSRVVLCLGCSDIWCPPKKFREISRMFSFPRISFASPRTECPGWVTQNGLHTPGYDHVFWT
jgi:hypothetical protein